jgi:hypothetical protein
MVAHSMILSSAFINRIPSILRTGLPPLLAFAPALVLWVLIRQFAVDMPYWDDWERGVLLEKWYGGTLTFKDLNAPHIDHRMLFPRLLILLLNELSGGNLRWEMMTSFVFGLLAAVGLWALARQTVFADKMNWSALFLINLLVFSPMQWDNWVWGIQLAFMLPMTCLIWSLVFALKPWIWWQRLAICLPLAVVATHSFGHGFAVWPAVFCLALLRRDFAATRAQRMAFLSFWLAAGAAVISCYLLVDFQNTSHPSHSYGQAIGAAPPSVEHARVTLSKGTYLWDYLSVLAGNSIARLHLVDPLKLAEAVGSGLITLFLIAVTWALGEGWRKKTTWDQALPWMALGFSSLLGMTAVAMGRANVIGLSRATCARYNSISLYLIVALLVLAILWWQNSTRIKRWPPLTRARLSTGVLALVTGYLFTLWNYGGQMMSLCHDARWQAKASLHFINFFEPEPLSRLDGSLSFLREMANTLNDRNLLSPPLATDLALDQFKAFDAPRSRGQAQLEHVTTAKDGGIQLQGYARIGNRPADAILFTWETASQPPEIFALAAPTMEMVPQLYPGELEMVGRNRPGVWDSCKWQKRIHLSADDFFSPQKLDEVLITCWILDAQKQFAYRIKGAILLRKDGQFEVKNKSESTLRYIWPS